MIKDQASYIGKELYAVEFEKFVNGEEADNPSDLLVLPTGENSSITYTYVITNTGLLPLGTGEGTFALIDDNGTPDDTSDDLTYIIIDGVTSTQGLTLTDDDTDGNGLLDADETWTITADVQAVQEGLVTNTADITVAETELATDTASYLGKQPIAVNFEKFVNGAEANDPENPLMVAEGSSITYTYVIENIGFFALGGGGIQLRLVDDNGTPDDTSDDLSVRVVSAQFDPDNIGDFTLTGGDINGDSILDTDVTWTITANQQVAQAGLLTNTAQVKVAKEEFATDTASYKGFLEPEIDWKPGSNPSAIDLSDNGTVPVAILGTSTFDVTGINIDSIRADDDQDSLLNGGSNVGVKVKRNGTYQFGFEDVNGDGFTDLVLKFESVDLGSVVQPDQDPFLSEQQIYLYGQTTNGDTFLGSQPLDDPLKFV